MTVFDFILIGVAVFGIIMLLSMRMFSQFSKPVHVGADGLRYVKDGEMDAWVARAERVEKVLNPTIILISSGASVAVWVLYRVVLSFL